MPSVEECQLFATKCRTLSASPDNSARRAAVLKNMANSWAALASQLASLAMIEKSEAARQQDA